MKIRDVFCKKIEHKKYKEIGVWVNFYNKPRIGWHADYPVDSKQTSVSRYRDFYKWFFCRNSEKYCFIHENGANVFKKCDIQSIDFYEMIKDD